MRCSEQNADQWFYHPIVGLRSLSELQNVYHNSVGRNGERLAHIVYPHFYDYVLGLRMTVLIPSTVVSVCACVCIVYVIDGVCTTGTVAYGIYVASSST